MADLTPITREEKIIAGEDVKPVTREEKILAGMDIVPVTRREKFLKAFGGGGSGGDEEELKITDARHLFREGARFDIKDSLIPLIKDCTEFGYAFYNCYSGRHVDFVECPNVDTSKAQGLAYMFYSCRQLETISKLDLNSAMGGWYGGTDYIFEYCESLKNLYLYNIRASIQIGSGTSWGHLLTVDSLVHTIKELCTVTSTKTLTIGSANLEKISGLYCKITDDTDEKKPMELCESTDEGAMLLTDYAMEKGWTIK